MTTVHNNLNSYMPSRLQIDPWDLSEVRELLNKLSTPSPAVKQEDPIASYGRSLSIQERPGHASSTTATDKDTVFSGLGDLSSVWKFLAVDGNAPAPTPPAPPPVPVPGLTSLAPPVTLESIQDREAYASDGALYCPPSSKSIKWRDELDGQEIADPPQDAPPETPLTKSQRKKLRRKQAQREQREKAKSTSDAESETDTQTPARKASVHTLAGSTQHLQQTRHEPRSRTVPSTPVTKPAATQLSAELVSLLDQPKKNTPKSPKKGRPMEPEEPKQSVQPTKPASATPSKSSAPSKPSAPAILPSATPATPATPKTKPSRQPKAVEPGSKLLASAPSFTPVTPVSKQIQHVQQAKTPLQQSFSSIISSGTPTIGPARVMPGLTPYNVNPGLYAQLAQSLSNPQPLRGAQHSQMVQLQLQLEAQARVQAQTEARAKAQAHAQILATPTPLPPQAHTQARAQALAIPTPLPPQPQKIALRQGADRHYHFLLKVIRNFGEDMKWLVSPAQSKNHTTSPTGIHVFVDASNILIGFYERLRHAKGIPKTARMARPEFDFDALVLLLERRRPVAKRVLAGSNPHVPTFEKANGIGYELNILDKVKKARELTERQKYFQARDAERGRGRRGSHSGKENASGGSGSETVATTPAGTVLAPEKWVEQGVDEILHLKILESVVDADVPSTIVLATGDAAEAEYSQGFLKMVERALRKGWRVEVVAWGKSISFAYRDRAFQEKWKDSFRVIELDDYVEDLLDV